MDVQFGPYRLKRAERLLLGPDGQVELSARSFDILAALLASPDRVVSKAKLFETAWPGLIVEDNTLQVHMSALRKALPAGMIKTVHGRGYQYAGPRPSTAQNGKARHSGVTEQPVAWSARGAHKPVIAVLPFANRSGEPAQDYFGNGLAEDIIVELSRNRLLTVVARTSTSLFKGRAVDLTEAAARLGADYLVEGSVRKSGSGVRVTAQLLDTVTGSHVWAERYDREFSDAFAVQDDLVLRLVSTIVGHVEKHTDARARMKATESLDAYDLWLRAIFGGNFWTLEGNAACRRLLETSIGKDPLFARAHASLAFCDIRDSMMMPGSPEIPALDASAVRNAEHALHLDGEEVRAHHAIGWSSMYLREFDRARSSFAISASLNPNDGSACIDRSLALAFLGEQDEADETAERAAILNPLGGDWFYVVRAMVHFIGRRYEAAETCFTLGPRTWLPDLFAFRAANATRLGEHRLAAEYMRQALDGFALLWRGSGTPTPSDFLTWFHHINMLRRADDWDHVFAAFPKAELKGANLRHA